MHVHMRMLARLYMCRCVCKQTDAHVVGDAGMGCEGAYTCSAVGSIREAEIRNLRSKQS